MPVDDADLPTLARALSHYRAVIELTTSLAPGFARPELAALNRISCEAIERAFGGQPAPTAPPVEAIEAVVTYCWADEERDYDHLGPGSVQTACHIFRHLQTIRAWLDEGSSK